MKPSHLWRAGPGGRPSSKNPDMRKVLYSRRNNFTHSTTLTRASVTTTLSNLPKHQLHDAVLQYAKTGDLDRNAMIDYLKKMRAFKRLDLSEIAVQAYQEGGKAASPHHLTLLMSTANALGEWTVALKYWKQACNEHKIRPITHSVHLQTLRVAGKWRQAVAHFDSMIADKVPIEPHALHCAMNTCRQHAPWDVSLRLFAKGVSDGGAVPNSTVFLVLLRCLNQSMLPARWHYSLSILSGLAKPRATNGPDEIIERNAGMYNAVMETLSSCKKWQSALSLYHSMKSDSIVPSNDTFRILMELRKWDPTHCVRALAEAHHHSSRVSPIMYLHVLQSLIAVGRADQAAKLAEAEMKRSAEDSGNPNSSISPLSFALLDAVLNTTDPEACKLLMEKFEANVETAVPHATRGLAVLGNPLQRWVAESGSRICVVDHNTLRSKYFETLLHHYDHIMIPLSAIRVLVHRTEGKLGGTASEHHNEWLFKYLRNILQDVPLNSNEDLNGGGGAKSVRAVLHKSVHILPLWHELHAHSFVVPKNAASSSKDSDLMLLRKSANSLTAERLLQQSPQQGDDDDGMVIIRGGHMVPQVQRPSSAVSPPLAAIDEKEREEPPFPTRVTSLSPVEKVVSVAVMLKTLNPTSSVHVVSQSDHTLSEVLRWNMHSTQHHKDPVLLKDVKLPTDLLSKAPPRQHSSNAVRLNAQFQQPSAANNLDGSNAEFIAS